MKTIGERIRYLRKTRKLSMAELGEAIGTDSGNIGNWENNRRIPGGNFIIALSRYFNVSTDWILTGKETSLPTNNDTDLDMLKELSEDEIKDVKKYIQFLAWRRKRGNNR